MDSNYIINRLKSTPYKYTTVDLLRTRLKNLDEAHRSEIIINLKMEFYKYRNMDIQDLISDLLGRKQLTSFTV